ncbi:MAG: hypothetical protein ACFFDT_04105 [Candidatus Hodarchaeota archaeon]
MTRKKVRRNTAAIIGQIIAVIGGLLILLGALNMFLDLGEVPLAESGDHIYFSERDLEDDINTLIVLIIAILIVILILGLELDRIVLQQHIVRGILYVVMFLVGGIPAGILILIAGICYIVAEFT